MEWISCKDELPPIDEKFLFHYHCGTGIGEWAYTYPVIEGHSIATDPKYLLILWPSEIVAGESPLEFDDRKMIEMDIYWMPLPQYSDC